MEKDLVKFMKNITFLNKDMSEYMDEKGNYYIIPNGQLICSCTYNELTKQEYERALFEMQIDKLDYETEKVKRPASKYARTKKEEDRYKIEDATVMIYKVWQVSNGLKKSKSFTNKKEAVELATKINDEVLHKAEII